MIPIPFLCCYFVRGTHDRCATCTKLRYTRNCTFCCVFINHKLQCSWNFTQGMSLCQGVSRFLLFISNFEASCSKKVKMTLFSWFYKDMFGNPAYFLSWKMSFVHWIRICNQQLEDEMPSIGLIANLFQFFLKNQCFLNGFFFSFCLVDSSNNGVDRGLARNVKVSFYCCIAY